MRKFILVVLVILFASTLTALAWTSKPPAGTYQMNYEGDPGFGPATVTIDANGVIRDDQGIAIGNICQTEDPSNPGEMIWIADMDDGRWFALHENLPPEGVWELVEWVPDPYNPPHYIWSSQGALR